MNVNFLLSPDPEPDKGTSGTTQRPPGGRSTGRSTSQSSRPMPETHRHELIHPSHNSIVGSSRSPATNMQSSSDHQVSGVKRTDKSRGRASSSTDNSPPIKPHVCPYCDRSFFKPEQLRRHDRLVHLNHRPFVCTVCDVSFGTKQNMQVHMTTRKHQQRFDTLQTLNQAKMQRAQRSEK